MSGVIIFGGSGFIARSLYDELSAIPDFNVEIYAVSRGHRPGAALPHGVEAIFADVTKPQSLDSIPININVSRCLYLADASTLNIMPAAERYKSAVEGISGVAEFCGKRGIKDLTYFSSGAVYSPSPYLKTEYSQTLSPHDEISYAAAKVFAEQFLLESSKNLGLNVKIARCFSFVGNHLPNAHFAVMNFLWNAFRGEDICVTGSGAEVRSYLHQKELARAIVKICLYDQSTIVNIGSEARINILELASLIAKMFGSRVKHLNIVGKVDQNCYVPNVGRYKKLFGELEFYTLEERLQRTYDTLFEVGAA